AQAKSLAEDRLGNGLADVVGANDLEVVAGGAGGGIERLGLDLADAGNLFEELGDLGQRTSHLADHAASSLELIAETLRRVLGHHPATREDDDLAADHLHLGKDVRGEDDGPLLAQLLDEIAHFANL